MSLIDEGKSVLNLINKAANRELYDAMIGYLDKVFELTMERAKLLEQVQAAEKRSKELEEAMAFSKRLSPGQNAYWTEELDYPYCSGCWESKKLAVRLVIDWRHDYTCPICRVKVGHIQHPTKKG